MPQVIVAVAALAAQAGVATALGGGAWALFAGTLVAMGVSWGGSSIFGLLPEPMAALDPLENPDTWLTNEPSNNAPLPVVYGERRMGGTVVFAEVNGSDNRHLDVVYAIAEGEVEEIGTLYLDGEPAPESQVGIGGGAGTLGMQVLELNGVTAEWFRIRVKVAEAGSVTGSTSGKWDDVTAYADNDYAGTMELTRGPLDPTREWQTQPAGWDYAIEAMPYNLADWPQDEQPTVTVRHNGAGGRLAVDVEQQPTEANGYELVLLIDRRPYSDPQEFQTVQVFCRFFSQGAAEFQDRVECWRHHGADGQGADANLVARSERWTSDHRLQGVAYCYVRFTHDPDAYPRGIPSASWDVKGRKLYDPRTEVTEWSSNPALVVRDYLTNARYGRGVDADQVDDAAIISAANYCDEVVEVDQTRWTCNGAVDTSRTALQNMTALLTSCRGWLTYVAGVYRLVLDAPATSSISLDESDITGAWSLDLGDKSTMANRVQARFYDPGQDWQTAYAMADSEGLRELDRGLLLERSISLEFTSNHAEAYRHAAITLNQSRQAMRVGFTLMPAGLNVTPGDVVRVTHQRPGWSLKEFRAGTLRALPEGLVEVQLLEYSATVYDWGTIPVQDPAPDTNLPSPGVVEPPGNPSMVEELYETRGGSGVKVRLAVSWAPSADHYLADYLVEARGPGLLEGEWVQLIRTPHASAQINDVAPGTWLVRVRAVNSLGIRSEPTTTAVAEVMGLLAPPATPSNLSAAALSQLVVLSWSPTSDLDVQIGGRYDLRFVPESVSSPTWDNGQLMGYDIAGSATQVVVPGQAGTYFLKAVDSSGIPSALAASVEVLDAGGMWDLVQIGSTWTGGPAWTGTATDVEIDPTTDALRLVESGGEVVELEGTWTGSSTMVLTTDQRVQLRAELAAGAYNLQDDFDDRTGYIDTWPSFDGDADGAAAAEVWGRCLNTTSGIWTPWQRLTTAEFMGRVFQFRLVLRSTGPAYNVAVSQLTVTALEVS